MAWPKCGRIAVTRFAIVGSLAATLTTANAAVPTKTFATDPALLAGTALIMGGTGMPDPPQHVVDLINEAYVQPNFPGYTSLGLYTPEESWPLFGSMTGEESVAAGVKELHTAITETYAGENLLVFGASQSALIAATEMRELAANPPADLGELHFALLGGPTNFMGGIFSRLADFDIPYMDDLTQYSAAPTDAFPTDVYGGEYDPVSDFPRYPANIWSSLNALAGLFSVHLGYENITAEQVDSAIHLGHTGMTDYYMMPTPILPLLQPLYESGDMGKMLADYLQPQLKVLVDLGYGNLEHGLVPDPGGVDGAGLIGFIPKLDPLAVLAAYQLGQVEGTVNLANDLLASVGADPVSDDVTDALKSAFGYDDTVELDQAMRDWLTDLSTQPGSADLNPEVLFDGQPLIDGTPFIDSVNQWFDDMFWWLPG